MISTEEIASISKTIVDKYCPGKAILFGSYTSKTANENSDLDLMIISDRERTFRDTKEG